MVKLVRYQHLNYHHVATLNCIQFNCSKVFTLQASHQAQVFVQFQRWSTRDSSSETIWFRMLKYELCIRKMLAHIKPANITIKNWKNEKVLRKENKMKKNRWFVCHFVWWVSLDENRIKYCKEENFDNSVLY